MSKHPFHTEQFTIRANEVDSTGKLSLGAICNFFQEVAGNHAKVLNFDIIDMKEQNLTWVLHRMDINLHETAEWRDTITVETWPAAGDSLRAYRNYRILNADGIEIGNCLSYWMVLNLETRRPERIPQDVLDTRLLDRPHVTEAKSNRLRPFKEKGVEKEIIVRRSDMDMNNHVNNVRYMEWMLETIEQELTQAIRHFEILFMRETFVDDRLTTSSYSDGDVIKFKISNQDGNIISIGEATF